MRCLFAQLKIGEEFYFESKKFRKVGFSSIANLPEIGNNIFIRHFSNPYLEKGKPGESQGRKVTGLSLAHPGEV